MKELLGSVLPWVGYAVVAGLLSLFAWAIWALVFVQVRESWSLRRRGISPPPSDRSAKRVFWGLLFLSSALFLGAHILTVYTRPFWFNLLLAITFTLPVFGLACLSFLGRGGLELPETMAYFDFFGRLSPLALANVKGPLGLAAWVLHRNIDRLKGRFTVITMGVPAPELPPRAWDLLEPRYVALVDNYVPVGLFFYTNGLGRFSRTLKARELRYELTIGSDTADVEWFYPEISWRERWARRGRVRARLRGQRLDARNIQRLIDAFVEKMSPREVGGQELSPDLILTREELLRLAGGTTRESTSAGREAGLQQRATALGAWQSGSF